MYNEALVNALNADRQRSYDELEMLRRQREITTARAAESAAVTDASTGRRTRAHRRPVSFGHVATR
jgi:hypothetical protein